MLYKKSIFLLLLICLNSIGRAQNQFDSLKSVWINPNLSDTTRLNALYQLTWEKYLFTYNDSGFYFAKSAYNFATEKGLKKQISDALILQGVCFAIRGNHFLALDYYQQSFKIREEINDQKGIGNCYNVIGLVYQNQNELGKAMDYFQKAISIFKSLKLKKELAAPFGNIAAIYKDQGKYKEAKAYTLEALKIQEEENDKRGISISLSMLGTIEIQEGNPAQGIEYIKRSLLLDEELSDNFLLARHFNNIGQIYETKGYYKEAKLWCARALEKASTSGNSVQEKSACNCLFKAYKSTGDHKKALEFYERMTVVSDSLNKSETIKKLQAIEFSNQMEVDSLARATELLEMKLANETLLQRKNTTRNILFGIGVILLILSASFYFRWKLVKEAKLGIEKEKDRSDNLLLNILPSEIAEELMNTGKSEARDFTSVTVLFTDFVGFTQLSEKLSAKELVEEISLCFEAFDEIVGKYGIEKIKTIGDSYMAAGGIPIPFADSVKNTVLAAIEMQSFIANRSKHNAELGRPSFKMRVGINTGPLVAGIVGVKKFQYDIWGDTVNTASRIESSGEAGMVNIGDNTYQILKENKLFTFEKRGKISAKGKGEMEMYYVHLANSTS